jgi:hypothetical protein
VFFAKHSDAQRSRLIVGDKNLANVGQSIELFQTEITQYEAKITDLKKENKKLIAHFQKATKQFVMDVDSAQVAENNALIAGYRKQISEMETKKESFINSAAGKDKTLTVEVRGNNPSQWLAASDAYMTIKAADAYAAGAGSNNPASEGNFKGVVVNYWYQPVQVMVSGPGHFYREYHLKQNGDKVFFDFPYPGDYVFTFATGETKKSVVKKAGPGHIYQDAGKDYDLMATLPNGCWY